MDKISNKKDKRGTRKTTSRTDCEGQFPSRRKHTRFSSTRTNQDTTRQNLGDMDKVNDKKGQKRDKRGTKEGQKHKDNFLRVENIRDLCTTRTNKDKKGQDCGPILVRD